jgi:type II secretory pathway predicted ATPase ExeA
VQWRTWCTASSKAKASSSSPGDRRWQDDARRALANRLAEEVVVLAHVVSTQLDGDDIVRMVAAAFGVPHHDSKAVLLNELQRTLLGLHHQGKRALLLVDEAQNLPLGAVEELRMLSNFQCDGKSLLQSFLLGQPEFRRTLQRPEMEQLKQRVIAACHLGPMDAAETRAYVEHRLRTAGWTGDPALDEPAFAAIHAHTGGIPRRINILCNRLLLLGFMDEKHALGEADVMAVVQDMAQEFAPLLPEEAIEAARSKAAGQTTGPRATWPGHDHTAGKR